MRKVELLRIKKYDINFRNRTIVVRTAKNHKTRIIHIDLKITIVLFFYCRNLQDDELLFKLSSVTVSCDFHRIIERSNIKKITLRDIRHIYASYLLSRLRNSANSILFVSSQLGHVNAVETLRTYSHVMTADKKNIVKCLNFI